jgi:hypothetical protein
MPVLTPNFSLPVPAGTDAPCDFPQQWCDFTDATQTVLDTFEAVADRTNPNVPMAKLELRNTVHLAIQSHIPFDTLTINNAGMVDFDASNSIITINRPGRFLAVCNTLFVYKPPADLYFRLQVLANPTTPGIDNNLNIGLINVGSCATGIFHITSPPRAVRVLVELIGASTTISLDLAALSLFWFADGATP